MDGLVQVCRSASLYPKRVSLLENYPPQQEHHLQNHFKRLENRQNQLFQTDGPISLNFWELDERQKGAWRHEKVRNLEDLQSRFNLSSISSSPKEPRCRFLFIWAESSQGRLYTTRLVLMTVFTYLQVLPSYLDFIYPFGEQQYPQDSYFNAFKADSILSDSERGIQIPELERSGRCIRMCYSLKSVEPSRNEKGLPWSVRQGSIYHSFDIETGNTNWIVIKGDHILKERMSALSGSSTYVNLHTSDSKDRLLAATFDAHLVICDWAEENWRWYLGYLEEEFQLATRQSYAIPVSAEDSLEISPLAYRNRTLSSVIDENSANWFSTRDRSPSDSQQPPRGRVPQMNHRGAKEQAIRMKKLKIEQEKARDRAKGVFNFENLQRLHYLEEKTVEALLLLESNAKVVKQIRKYYGSLQNQEDWPDSLKQDCEKELALFGFALEDKENAMLLQKARAETLLRIIENRRTMLHGILEYKNIEANNRASRKAQDLTWEMHLVAKKTARQTDLMAIIAVVTVLFLPGTFISAFMSANIVTWSLKGHGEWERQLSWPGLKMYLIATLPLTGAAVLLCFAWYWWTRIKSAVRRRVRGELDFV